MKNSGVNNVNEIDLVAPLLNFKGQHDLPRNDDEAEVEKLKQLVRKEFEAVMMEASTPQQVQVIRKYVKSASVAVSMSDFSHDSSPVSKPQRSSSPFRKQKRF